MAETGTWFPYTASDGYALRALRFLPSGDVRGRILMLHGIQSHAGWYGATCQALNQAGYEVLFADRRGSGLHEVGRGDTPNWWQIVDDAQAARTAAWGNAPCVVVGISWGAKIALALAKRHPTNIQAVSLWAPGLCPAVKVSFLERVRIFLTRVFRPTALVPIPLNDPALFTASEQWRRFLREDPHALHQATARFMVESVRLDTWLAVRKWDLPVLVLLAGQEKIVDNARTRAWADRRLRKKQVIEYPAAYHTLEFEADTTWRDHFLAWLGNVK